MAKRLVIDYGTDTLIDLDAPRQNLGQRYNIGGLVRQNKALGDVAKAIKTDWPKIVKKWNEIFPPKAVESKDADFISLIPALQKAISMPPNLSLTFSITDSVSKILVTSN